MASEIRERERERKLEISRRKKIIAACRWATTAIVQSTNVCGGGGIRAFSLLRQVCFPFFWILVSFVWWAIEIECKDRMFICRKRVKRNRKKQKKIKEERKWRKCEESFTCGLQHACTRSFSCVNRKELARKGHTIKWKEEMDDGVSCLPGAVGRVCQASVD